MPVEAKVMETVEQNETILEFINRQEYIVMAKSIKARNTSMRWLQWRISRKLL